MFSNWRCEKLFFDRDYDAISDGRVDLYALDTDG